MKPTLTVVEAHNIANNTEKALKANYGKQSIVNIHIEPYNGEKLTIDKSCND